MLFVIHRNTMKIIPHLFLVLLLLGCEKIELTPEILTPQVFVQAYTNDNFEANSISSSIVLERAYQMANVRWTPLDNIPFNKNSFFLSGVKVSGVPYSSVKELNTYLFQDVSYYTFMTAVHNPRSVLYTDNISQPPYHGLNCGTYYGAVCSSSVMYALGFNIPFYADQIVQLPFMEKVEPQVVDSLKVCDIIWKSGHVQMVFDIEHQADSLYKVTMFESSGKSAHIKPYSIQDFKKMWEKNQYEAYRYKFISYDERPESFNDLPSISYNDDLCPSKGDKSVYRDDDTITINIFNPNYSEIVLMKNGELVSSIAYKGDLHKYEHLQPGLYSVFLQSGDNKTDSVSFEVIDTHVDFSVNETNRSISIYFSSSAVADFAALCTLDGSSLYYPISNDDRAKGYVVVPKWNYPEYYCKVIFKGKYGSMINHPIRVK